MRHFIYYNLHREMFSCKNWETKLVEHRTHGLRMSDCTFKVSEAGRQRVLKEKKKNVHAGVLGVIKRLDYTGYISDDFKEIYYNPYETKAFMEGDKIVTHAEEAILRYKRIYAKGLTYE